MPFVPTIDRLGGGRAATVPAWALPCFAVSLSVVLFLLTTRHGIGVLPDSTRYMGITTLPYDAPMYPWLLSLVSQTGTDIVDSAKLIGLLLAVVNTSLTWALLARATGSTIATSVGTALIILSPQFVSLHAAAMSEPLFMTGLLLSIFAFLEAVESGRRRALVACAVLVALTALVRFTAPAMGAAIAACLLLNPRQNMRQRVFDTLVFGAIASAIFLSWVVVAQSSAGHSIGRDLHFYGNMGPREWMTSLTAMTAWLLPDDVPVAIRLTALVTALVTAGYAVSRSTSAVLANRRESPLPPEALLPTLLGLFFVAYMAFMVLSTSLEANLYLNSRYAFPAYLALVLMATIIAARHRYHGLSGSRVTVVLTVLAAIVLAGHSVRTTLRTIDNYDGGIGYASVNWQHSPIVAALKGLPASGDIYTNAPDLVGYVTRRTAYFIPQLVPSRTGVPDPANPYRRQIATVRNELRRSGYVVFFDRVDWRPYLGTEAELIDGLELRLVTAAADGRIYVSRHRATRGVIQ